MDLKIGSKIKSLRKEKGLSQEELCGDYINRVVLSRIENNKMLPSIPQLFYIAEKLDVPVYYFFIETEQYDYLFENSYIRILENLYKENKFSKVIELVNKQEFKNINDINKYFFTGLSYYNLNMHSKSEKSLKKYIRLYLQSNSSIQKNNIINFATAINTLFKIEFQKNNYDKCIYYLKLAIKYLNIYDCVDSKISYIIHNNLAYLYLENSKFQKVINLLENILEKHKNLNYIDIMPDIYISLNIAHYNLGNYEKSITYAKKAIYAFLYIEDIFSAGACYLNYINALRYSGKYDEAFRLIDSCKKDYSNNNILINRFLIQEMILHFNVSNYDKALEISKNIKRKYLSSENKNSLYFMLGHIYFYKHDFFRAYKYLKKCENYFISKNYSYDLSVLYKDLYEITGDENYKVKWMSYDNLHGRKNIFT